MGAGEDILSDQVPHEMSLRNTKMAGGSLPQIHKNNIPTTWGENNSPQEMEEKSFNELLKTIRYLCGLFLELFMTSCDGKGVSCCSVFVFEPLLVYILQFPCW